MANQLKTHAIEIHFKPFMFFFHLLIPLSPMHSRHPVEMKFDKHGENRKERKSINFFLLHFLTFAVTALYILSVNTRLCMAWKKQLNSFVSCRRLITHSEREQKWKRRREWRFCVHFQFSIYKSIRRLCLTLVSLKIQ